MGGYPDEINSVWEDIRMRWTLYGRKSGSDELCTVGFPDEINFVWEDIRMRGQKERVRSLLSVSLEVRNRLQFSVFILLFTQLEPYYNTLLLPPPPLTVAASPSPLSRPQPCSIYVINGNLERNCKWETKLNYSSSDLELFIYNRN